MKYSNTSRILSVIFHALIVAVFGALAIYYTAFVVPFFFTLNKTQFNVYSDNYGFYLPLELAVLGITVCAAGVFGLYNAIKALKNSKDDSYLVKSFVAFMCAGAAAAVFLLLNGTMLFQLLTNGGKDNVAFVIVVCLLLAIGLLIAINIPMVKMFDGKDNSMLVAAFSLTAGVAVTALGLNILFAYFGSLSQGIYSNSSTINSYLIVLAMVALIIGVLGLASSILMFKGKSQTSKLFKLGQTMGLGTTLLLGFAMIMNGVFDIVLKDRPVHFIYKDSKFGNSYAYPVLSIIIGAVLLMGATALFFFLRNPEKEDTKKITAK